jgi:hypothetical protein
MLANQDFGDSVGQCDRSDSLDSFHVAVATIARHNERVGRRGSFSLRDSIKYRLYEIGQIVGLIKDLDLFAKTAGSWLLV